MVLITYEINGYFLLPQIEFLGSWLSLPSPATNAHLIQGFLAGKKCQTLQRKCARSQVIDKTEISSCFLIYENKLKIVHTLCFLFSYSLLLNSFLNFSQWLVTQKSRMSEQKYLKGVHIEICIKNGSFYSGKNSGITQSWALGKGESLWNSHPQSEPDFTDPIHSTCVQVLEIKTLQTSCG